jgi:hypothetical protein
MSKKKTALVFFAGAVFGISSLIAGLYLWHRIDEWLPYSRPDAATVAEIEKIASQQKIKPVGSGLNWPPKMAALPVDEYRRWYVQGKEDGREVIWGEWDKQGKPGLYLGHRRYPPDLQFALGGGCGWVHLRYDIRTARLDTFMCNAPL